MSVTLKSKGKTNASLDFTSQVRLGTTTSRVIGTRCTWAGGWT